MKILVLLGWASGFGGVEKVVRVFADFMTKEGHEVSIAIDRTGVKSTRWLEGCRWRFVDVGMEQSGIVWKVRRVAVCAGLLLSIQPDVVITDIPYLLSCLHRARRFTAGLSRPVIASWVQTHLGPSSARWMRYADGHLALSQEHMDIIADMTGRPDGIRVVNNPVMAPETLVRRSEPDSPHLLFIGRLAPEKRVDLILVALSELLDTGWTLTIIGEGPAREELQALARSLSLPSGRVTWTGWLEEPWTHVRDATVLVLPSPREGFGLVLIEAMARGIPVITSDGQSALAHLLLEGGAGWQFPRGDAHRLAAILRGIAVGAVPLPDPVALSQLCKPYQVEEWGAHFERCLQELANVPIQLKSSAGSLA